MSKQTSTVRVEDNKLQGHVEIESMSVAGGDLPNGFQVKLNVRIDFTDADPVKVAEVACGGQSLRVILQGQLRKYSTAKLREMAAQGYAENSIPVADLYPTGDRITDPKRQAESAYSRMDLGQKREYLANVLGLPADIVEATLAKEANK
jgi:hypothetical protein